MPQPMKGPRFGGNAAHSRIILRNLTSQLFEHGRVVTTLAKAKQVRPIAEKLITRAKVDTVANRRIVNKTITDKGVSHVLFTEIAPMMAERKDRAGRRIRRGRACHAGRSRRVRGRCPGRGDLSRQGLILLPLSAVPRLSSLGGAQSCPLPSPPCRRRQGPAGDARANYHPPLT